MDVSGKPCFYCNDPAHVSEALLSHLRLHRLTHGVLRLGLAVSGGADSVALFHLMIPVCREAGIAVTVVHLNHGIRTEADDDARFVRELAEREGVAFLCEKVSVPDLIKGGRSLEMAAREARMAFFARCCASAGLDAIATGHQADDVAESVLLRLARGAGATGLSGLRPRSHTRTLTLIRPLLAISGAALRTWLLQRNLTWREDASNRDSAIPRNRIRNDVLPLLESVWMPELRACLCQSAEVLREDDRLLETLATQSTACFDADDSVIVSALLRQPEALQRRILRQWIFRQGEPEAAGLAAVFALLNRCRTSGDWKHQLPGGTLAVCTNHTLRLQTADTSPPPAAALLGSDAALQWGALEICARRGHGIISTAAGIGVYPAACALSAEKLKGGDLCVRTRKPGDRIAPTGFDGTKKIHDLFVDAKIPERQRDMIPVFVCGEAVVWIPGYRVSRHFAVPSPDAPSVQIAVRLKQISSLGISG